MATVRPRTRLGRRREQPPHAPRVVTEGDFQFSPGVFTYGTYKIARLEEDELKQLYVPKRTIAAATLMKRYQGDAFVAAQFAHYGVDYAPIGKNAARGTVALQFALLTDKMNRVSDEVLALEADMSRRWIELYGIPQYILDLHFLTKGFPDLTKTSDIVPYRFDHLSPNDSVEEMLTAFRQTPGLHAIESLILSGRWVYAGWDLAKVQEKVAADREQCLQEAHRAEEEMAFFLAGREPYV